jgi:HK97 family phage portal protein
VKLLQWFRDFLKRPSVLKVLPFTLPTWNRGLEIRPLINYQTYCQEGYGRNSVVCACIRKIATTAPSASFIVNRLVGNQYEFWAGHPLQSVFLRPNPYLSQFVFQESIHTFLNLAGECFIIKVGFGGKVGRSSSLGEMYLVRPDRMHPVPGGKTLLGFVYIGDDGQRLPFLPDEIIHIKYPDPYDRWEGLGRGFSPLSAVAYEVDVDNRATLFLRDFFDNAAVPSGLLKTKHLLDDPEIARIRARLRAQYSGERKWHETMILDADADYQRMGLSFEEMSFPSLRGLSESRICAVFDVPPVVVGVQVGLDRSTFTNYEQSRKALWMDKIIPDNQRIAEAFTLSFRDQLGDSGIVSHNYTLVQSLREDRNAQFARASQGYLGGWITRNEARREVGFAPHDGGDVLLQSPKNMLEPVKGWKDVS